MSKCLFPLCTRHAESNGYCIGHRMYATGETRRKERVTVVRPTKKISEKRAEEEKLYKKIVQEMFKTTNECEIKSPDCVQVADGLHHKKRRGINYLKKEFLVRACSPCNSFIENHVEWAQERGLLLSRFS